MKRYEQPLHFLKNIIWLLLILLGKLLARYLTSLIWTPEQTIFQIISSYSSSHYPDWNFGNSTTSNCHQLHDHWHWKDQWFQFHEMNNGTPGKLLVQQGYFTRDLTSINVKFHWYTKCQKNNPKTFQQWLVIEVSETKEQKCPCHKYTPQPH